MPLSVLVPTPITDTVLISSTAPETDYAAYNAGTTYAVGDKCISTTTHRIYESLRAGNLANDPTLIINRSGVTPWWQDAEPTNRHAMFDGEVNTQTELASPLTVVLRPGHFDSLFLAGIDAEQLAVTVTDTPGGTVVFSYDGILEDSLPDDYWSWCFGAFKPQTDFITSDIPPYHTAEMTVTLSSSSGTVKCGILSLGLLLQLGETQYGARAEPKTYSYIDTDSFGRTKIVRRHSARDMEGEAMLVLEEADSVLAIITSLLDVPVACIGTELPHYSGLRAFGLISGSLSYDAPKDVKLSFRVKGSI